MVTFALLVIMEYCREQLHNIFVGCKVISDNNKKSLWSLKGRVEVDTQEEYNYSLAKWMCFNFVDR